MRIIEDNHKINPGSGVGFMTRQWCGSGHWSALFKIFYLFFGGGGGSLPAHCHSLVVLKSE